MKKTLFLIFFIFLFIAAPAFAQTENEIVFLGLELEKLLSLVNALVSITLFIITFLALKRDGRKKLLYISIAFLVFAIRSFLVSLELFIEEIPYIDPIAAVLEFIALMSFFFGVFKK